MLCITYELQKITLEALEEKTDIIIPMTKTKSIFEGNNANHEKLRKHYFFECIGRSRKGS